MISHEPPARPPGSAGYQAATAARPDVDCNDRWVAWILRGRINDQLVWRSFVVWAGVLALSH